VLAMIQQTRDAASAVWVINDSAEDFGTVRVSWRVVDGDRVIADREEELELGAGAKLRVADLPISAQDTNHVDGDLVVRAADGRVVTRNRYRDLFGHPEHVAGHPTRMSHELGVRLYSA
jgi:beta-mannosidase